MSTFGGLNTAYRGLVAARQGLEVVGQNISNANTDGYTRQRITTSAVPAASAASLISSAHQIGQGVSVDGIARLGSSYLDARVQSTAQSSGYWSATATALSDVESALQEPGSDGISASLNGFWSAWQGVANGAGEAAPAAVLLDSASRIATGLSAAYADLDSQWTALRGKADSDVTELNDAATRVADLNGVIRATLAAGGSANELIDQRNTIVTRIASLTGATVRPQVDGTVSVAVGGNSIVQGSTSRAVVLTGPGSMAASGPLRLEWADTPGQVIALDGGAIAGTLSVLAPANAGGTGGAVAELAGRLNAFATNLAGQVNAVHQGGATRSGATGLDFFSFAAGVPAALGLTVVPTSAATIGAGSPGAGGFDGSIADAIAQLRLGSASPSESWSRVVTQVGVDTRSAAQQASMAGAAATSASLLQLSNASVDMDEENLNLLQFQTAYQGAARMMTAVDEMLDTLINGMGRVGR